jgi:pentatricopeptide repeat protein
MSTQLDSNIMSVGRGADGDDGDELGKRQRGRTVALLANLAIPQIGLVQPPCVVDVATFPSLLNTPVLEACTCKHRATDRAMYELLTSASKDGRMEEATALFWAHWSTPSTRDQNQCVAFIMQLCREELILEALRVLHLMHENNVSRTWRAFDALLKHMRTHKQVPYADEILQVLRLLPANCAHVRQRYGELFGSGMVGLAVRDIATEDRFGDCFCLLDVLLRQALLDKSCYEALANTSDTWGVLMRFCMERRQAVTAIAVWRRLVAFVAPSSSMFDMLVRTIVYTLEEGNLTQQIAVAFVADEPLARASPKDLIEFAVEQFVDWPRRSLGLWVQSSTSTLLLASSLRCERADLATKVFDAVFGQPAIYQRDEHTIVQLFRVLSTLALEPMILRAAKPILSQAREQKILSSGAVAGFMVNQLIIQHYAETLALYEELKQTKEVLIDTFIGSQVLKAVRCDKNDVVEMERLFKEMVALGVKPDVIMINQMQKSLLDHGRNSDAERLEAMKSADVFDVVTVNTRHRLLCQRGENLEEVINDLRKSSTTNELVSFGPLCDALVNFQRFDLVPAVTDLALNASFKGFVSSHLITSLLRLCGANKGGAAAIRLFEMFEAMRH